MHIALVCDHILYPDELVCTLKSLHDIFPKAPIYTTKYNLQGIDWFKNANIHTDSAKKRLNKAKYFSSLNLSSYDIIISVTSAEAKFIKKGNALHICYCFEPSLKYWQLHDEYVADPGFGALNEVVKFISNTAVAPLRRADLKSAQKPDYFLTPSTYSAEQIKKYYKRESTIIAPPVIVEKFSTGKLSTGNNAINDNKSQVKNSTNSTIKSHKRQGYISASSQVVWERLDLAVKACKRLNEPLTLIGDGPEHERLQKFVGNNPLITFLPTMDQKSLHHYFSQSRGYISPSSTSFGITSIAALSAGCPVIAYGKSGATDYIVDGENGFLFNQQTVDSLVSALKKSKIKKLSEEQIKSTALPFAESVFQSKIKAFIRSKLTK